MAEAAAPSNIPTFKLVLVGDGGTGKACIPIVEAIASIGLVPMPLFDEANSLAHRQLLSSAT